MSRLRSLYADVIRRFGGDKVARVDVLHRDAANPRATIVADIAQADADVPSNAFDCLILTQTLQYVFDLRSAVATFHRMLKPGGIALATVPGVSRIDQNDWDGPWFWNFTTLSVKRLFEECFAPGAVAVESFGNVLAAVAFLHGLSAGELSGAELNHQDSRFPVLVCVRACKAADGGAPNGRK